VLFRHALAPGGGDPPGFALQDCSTQRNLSPEGQAQAQRIGAEFRQRGIAVSAVWSSQWCSTRQTADLAFPGKRQDQALFNSFFATPERSKSQSQAALEWLAVQPAKGVTVVVTHQVNITDLTGIFPASGEGVVVVMQGTTAKVVGRITP
jgi:phosphohistidine phosphatase SixA